MVVDIIKRIKRDMYLHRLTDGVGKVEVLPDKVICYVDGEKVKKKCKHNCYFINLFGIGSNLISDYYGISDNVVYVVDGVNFDKDICISGLFDTIVFRNCTFRGNIYNINFAIYKLMFENNQYGEHKHIQLDKIEEITFNSDNCLSLINMDIAAKRVNFNDTIVSNRYGDFRVETPELSIKNSKIRADKVDIKADSIKGSNSELTAFSSIKLDSDDVDTKAFTRVASPTIMYNSDVLSNNGKSFSDNIAYSNNKRQLRSQVISMLKEVRDNCLALNSSKAQDIESNLNQRGVSRVLGKRNI